MVFLKQAVGLIVLITLFLASGCGSSSDDISVVFPKKGLSGFNLIEITYSQLDTALEYGLSANVLSGMPIKVVLSNLSDSLPKNSLTVGKASFWKVNELSHEGWYITEYDFEKHEQVFHIDAPKTAHAKIEFFGCGSAQLRVYENGKEMVEKSKEFNWKGRCPN